MCALVGKVRLSKVYQPHFFANRLIILAVTINLFSAVADARNLHYNNIKCLDLVCMCVLTWMAFIA